MAGRRGKACEKASNTPLAVSGAVLLSRREAVRAAALALLAACVAVPCARADEAGGRCTVSGVAGLDESATFSTLTEVSSALASCAGVEQPADGPGATILVYGTVGVGSQAASLAAVELRHPADGAPVAIVAADASAAIVGDAATGAQPSLSCPAGALVVRGMRLSGAVSLAARDGVTVESCSFDGGVSCTCDASIDVTGCVFDSPMFTGTALSAGLTGTAGCVSFTGNAVSGFDTGVCAWVGPRDAGQIVRVAANNFAFPDDSTVAGDVRRSVLRLAGGPWPASSVVFDRNAVAGSCAMVAFDYTFGAYGWSDGYSWAQTVEQDTLSADAVTSLFTLFSCDSSSAIGCTMAALDPTLDGSSSFFQVAEAASSMAMAVGVPAASVAARSAVEPASTVTVYYDANGATAGLPPDPVAVVAGSSVSAQTMGTLAYAGYVFQGWNTSADGSGIFYAAGQMFTPQEDMVLYAQWVPTGTVATVSVSVQTPSPAGAGA